MSSRNNAAYVCMMFCPMSPKLHATKLPPHPTTTSQSCQAMVISTPPTSPLSQFPDSFCRFPADLWCSFRFLGCCPRPALFWWVGSILWTSQQTGCVYLLVRRESTRCGLFSLFFWSTEKFFPPLTCFIKRCRNTKSLPSFCSFRLSCTQSTASNLQA